MVLDDPRAGLQACLADLADNKPAEAVLQRLRALEPALRDDVLARARFLRARAIATNRLGFGSEALGDLHEARHLLEAAIIRKSSRRSFRRSPLCSAGAARAASPLSRCCASSRKPRAIRSPLR